MLWVTQAEEGKDFWGKIDKYLKYILPQNNVRFFFYCRIKNFFFLNISEFRTNYNINQKKNVSTLIDSKIMIDKIQKLTGIDKQKKLNLLKDIVNNYDIIIKIQKENKKIKEMNESIPFSLMQDQINKLKEVLTHFNINYSMKESDFRASHFFVPLNMFRQLIFFFLCIAGGIIFVIVAILGGIINSMTCKVRNSCMMGGNIFSFKEKSYSLEKIFEIIFTKEKLQDISEEEAKDIFGYINKNKNGTKNNSNSNEKKSYSKRIEFISEILIEIQNHLINKEDQNGLASRETFIRLQLLLDNTAEETMRSMATNEKETKLVTNFISDFKSRYPFMTDLFKKHKNNEYQGHLNRKIINNKHLLYNNYIISETNNNYIISETNKRTKKQKVIDSIKRIRKLYKEIKNKNKNISNNKIANAILSKLSEIDKQQNIEEIKEEINDLKSMAKEYLEKNKLMSMINLSKNFEKIEININEIAKKKNESLKGIRKMGFFKNMKSHP